MSLPDSRAVGVKCPECGTWGAKKSLFKIKCVNPSCRKYDSEYASAYQQNRITGKSATEVFPHLKGTASPEDYSLRIRYRNFRGDEIIYSANPGSGYTKAEHLVIRVAPSGQRATFRFSAIQNRRDVESQLSKGPQPNPEERKILNHHLRRGTTSRLFKEVREKFPDYQP
jgi:hypothetical protein